ncbi:MAG: hypothetical protein DWI57_07195 [Chloroflexi bacterium]|nr:MAG: hypothetical protein DWI57_07195 [Chloroflexota bacterium]
MADERPQNNNQSSGGGGEKPSNHRYFRKRKGGPAGEGQPSSGQEKEQNRSQPDAKAQSGQTPEQRERRRKRRRSNNSGSSGSGNSGVANNSGNSGNTSGGSSSANAGIANTGGANAGSARGNSNRGGGNKRRSSSRRQRRPEQHDLLPPVAPETERYQEPLDVYVHTHIVRPAYRDAGNDYVSETSFLTKRPPAELTIHMERLQEEINGHLDEYFNRPKTPAKVIREAGDEDWDDEE